MQIIFDIRTRYVIERYIVYVVEYIFTHTNIKKDYLRTHTTIPENFIICMRAFKMLMEFKVSSRHLQQYGYKKKQQIILHASDILHV